MTLISRAGQPAEPRRGRPRGSRNKPHPPSSNPRLGLRVNELAEAIGVSRSAIKEAIKRGELKSFWMGQCEIIPMAQVKKLIGAAE